MPSFAGCSKENKNAEKVVVVEHVGKQNEYAHLGECGLDHFHESRCRNDRALPQRVQHMEHHQELHANDCHIGGISSS